MRGRLPGLTGWRYEAGGARDLRLDLLRGFAVFAMAVDHVGGPSPFHLLSGGNRFFVSAAEAFVFISGVTVGIVYSRRSETLRQVCRRAWGRSWTLYMVSVWLALAFAATAALAGIPKGAPFAADPGRFILDVVTLQRSYYLVEVMLLYAFLMALVPPIMYLVQRGVWWLVAAGSSILWAGYQLWPTHLVLPWRIVDYQNFPLAAWQLLFVAGILAGRYRENLGRALKRAPQSPLPGGLVIPLGVLCGLLIWLHVTDAAILDRWTHREAGAQLLDSWFNKTSLPLPRLLACAVVFGFAWQLVTVGWKPLRMTTGAFLLPLGSSALYAYGVHVLAACAIEIVMFHVFGDSALPVWQSFAIQATMLATIWSCTRLHVLQGQVGWLGRPPVAVGGGGSFRPAPSLAAVGAVLFAAVLGIANEDMGTSRSFASGSVDARRAAYNNPVTTVTPSRVSMQANGQVMAVVPQQGGTAEHAPTGSTVAAGQLLEGTLESAVLGRAMPYAIYLPPSYESQPERRFPVVYELHGAGGQYTEWTTYGLPQTAGEMMESGELTEFIIVMPEGGTGYWANGLGGDGEPWADYLLDDVVPYVDATYRTIPDAADRAIGGLSRGGFGALYLAFTHPSVFSIVAANSPALPGNAASIEGTSVPEDEFGAFDPVELAGNLNGETAPHIWLDIGDLDDWEPGVTLLDAVLSEQGVDHELSIADGGHTQEYWAARTPDYLRFYSSQFADR